MYTVCQIIFSLVICDIHIFLQLLKSCQDNEKATTFNQITKIAKDHLYLHLFFIIVEMYRSLRNKTLF